MSTWTGIDGSPKFNIRYDSLDSLGSSECRASVAGDLDSDTRIQAASCSVSGRGEDVEMDEEGVAGD
jgi:hypothetical protein